MRALESVAHPARLAIVRRLAESGPASLTELAEAAGVHENTARGHLAALEAGGLIASEPRPLDRPGRPGVSYRLADEALLAPSGLAQLLGAALARSGPRPEQLRGTGRDWGRYLSGRPGSHDAARKLPEVMDQLGFNARLARGAVELRGCPCKAVAPEQPELVACLAEGVVDGVLAACQAAQRIAKATHDPDSRRCHIALTAPAGEEAAGSRQANPARRRH